MALLKRLLGVLSLQPWRPRWCLFGANVGQVCERTFHWLILSSSTGKPRPPPSNGVAASTSGSQQQPPRSARERERQDAPSSKGGEQPKGETEKFTIKKGLHNMLRPECTKDGKLAAAFRVAVRRFNIITLWACMLLTYHRKPSQAPAMAAVLRH